MTSLVPSTGTTGTTTYSCAILPVLASHNMAILDGANSITVFDDATAMVRVRFEHALLQLGGPTRVVFEVREWCAIGVQFHAEVR
jgi:hypothetical protein